MASFIAYNEAKRIVKEPEVPFGEGAVEGIMASESSNNACNWWCAYSNADAGCAW